MLAADSRSKWPPELLTDPRVVHFWDEEKSVGTWYGENVTATKEGHVEWDAWFLYDAASTWGDDGPSDLVGWGRTIVQTRVQLKDDVFRQLDEEP